MTTKVPTTKFFSSVAPKNSDRPQARQLQAGDQWINGDDVKIWNGTAWADEMTDKKDDQSGKVKTAPTAAPKK